MDHPPDEPTPPVGLSSKTWTFARRLGIIAPPSARGAEPPRLSQFELRAHPKVNRGPGTPA